MRRNFWLLRSKWFLLRLGKDGADPIAVSSPFFSARGRAKQEWVGMRCELQALLFSLVYPNRKLRTTGTHRRARTTNQPRRVSEVCCISQLHNGAFLRTVKLSNAIDTCVPSGACASCPLYTKKQRPAHFLHHPWTRVGKYVVVQCVVGYSVECRIWAIH